MVLSAPDELTAAVAITAFIAEVIYGCTTFGAGVTFNISVHISHLLNIGNGSVKTAVLALSVPEFAVGVVQSILYGRQCNVLLLLVATVLIGGSLMGGTALLLLMTDSELVWVTRALGVLLLAMALESVISVNREASRKRHAGDTSPQEETALGTVPDLHNDRRSLLVTLGCFCSSGLLGGLTGVPGPPLMLYVRYCFRRHTLCRATWRSTSAVMRSIISGEVAAPTPHACMHLSAQSSLVR